MHARGKAESFKKTWGEGEWKKEGIAKWGRGEGGGESGVFEKKKDQNVRRRNH